MLDLAKECLALREAGLKRRDYRDSDGRDETRYLAPLQEFAARGTTPAEELLEKYNGPWGSARSSRCSPNMRTEHGQGHARDGRAHESRRRVHAA